MNEEELYKAMCRCDCTVIPLEQITDRGIGVFPFKALEFIVAGTHVIAPQLSPLQDLDLSYIQRWDGSGVESLLFHLSRAETEFSREQVVREQTINTILHRYNLIGVAELLSSLLSVRSTGLG